MVAGFAFLLDFDIELVGDEGPAVLPAGGVEEGEEGGAGAHLDEDVLAREIGQVGVVLLEQLGERAFAPSRSAGLCHGVVLSLSIGQ